MNRFCFFSNIKFGTTVIAIIFITISVAVIVSQCFPSEIKIENPFSGIILILATIQLIVSTLLCGGALQGIPIYLLFWLITNGVALIIAILGTLVLFVVLLYKSTFEVAIIFFMTMFMMLCLLFYIWTGVYYHYKEFDDYGCDDD